MAQFTQASTMNDGYTKLYIPKEDLTGGKGTGLGKNEGQIDRAIYQDKDLIQRLESTVIYWNHQIKDVVNNQTGQQENENAGPLDEINYWRKRKDNLAFI